MTALWIATIVVAFVVGFFVGMKTLVLRFKMELKNPKSEISKMFSGLVDQMDNDAAETCARGAEMYQDNRRCINNCGVEIARMLRESSKESS